MDKIFFSQANTRWPKVFSVRSFIPIFQYLYAYGCTLVVVSVGRGLRGDGWRVERRRRGSRLCCPVSTFQEASPGIFAFDTSCYGRRARRLHIQDAFSPEALQYLARIFLLVLFFRDFTFFFAFPLLRASKYNFCCGCFFFLCFFVSLSTTRALRVVVVVSFIGSVTEAEFGTLSSWLLVERGPRGIKVTGSASSATNNREIVKELDLGTTQSLYSW